MILVNMIFLRFIVIFLRVSKNSCGDKSGQQDSNPQFSSEYKLTEPENNPKDNCSLKVSVKEENKDVMKTNISVSNKNDANEEREFSTDSLEESDTYKKISTESCTYPKKIDINKEKSDNVISKENENIVNPDTKRMHNEPDDLKYCLFKPDVMEGEKDICNFTPTCPIKPTLNIEKPNQENTNNGKKKITDENKLISDPRIENSSETITGKNFDINPRSGINLNDLNLEKEAKKNNDISSKFINDTISDKKLDNDKSKNDPTKAFIENEGKHKDNLSEDYKEKLKINEIKDTDEINNTEISDNSIKNEEEIRTNEKVTKSNEDKSKIDENEIFDINNEDKDRILGDSGIHLNNKNLAVKDIIETHENRDKIVEEDDLNNKNTTDINNIDDKRDQNNKCGDKIRKTGNITDGNNIIGENKDEISEGGIGCHENKDKKGKEDIAIDDNKDEINEGGTEGNDNKDKIARNNNVMDCQKDQISKSENEEHEMEKITGENDINDKNIDKIDKDSDKINDEDNYNSEEKEIIDNIAEKIKENIVDDNINNKMDLHGKTEPEKKENVDRNNEQVEKGTNLNKDDILITNKDMNITNDKNGLSNGADRSEKDKSVSGKSESTGKIEENNSKEKAGVKDIFTNKNDGDNKLEKDTKEKNKIGGNSLPSDKTNVTKDKNENEDSHKKYETLNEKDSSDLNLIGDNLNTKEINIKDKTSKTDEIGDIDKSNNIDKKEIHKFSEITTLFDCKTNQIQLKNDKFLDMVECKFRLQRSEFYKILKMYSLKKIKIKDQIILLFPGNTEDYEKLSDNKNKKCKLCFMCNENKLCILETMKKLKYIAIKYPEWNEPEKNLENTKKILVHRALYEILIDIFQSYKNNCIILNLWYLDPMIKHLIDPYFIMSDKIQIYDSDIDLNFSFANMRPKIKKLIESKISRRSFYRSDGMDSSFLSPKVVNINDMSKFYQNKGKTNPYRNNSFFENESSFFNAKNNSRLNSNQNDAIQKKIKSYDEIFKSIGGIENFKKYLIKNAKKI